MKIVSFSLLLLLALFSSCDNCSDKACFSPPPPFGYELIDSETKENLLSNGTYQESRISITDLEGKAITPIIRESIIEVTSWAEGQDELTFKYDNVEIFKVQLELERVNEDCCSFVRIRNHEISGATSELSDSNNVHMVLIE